MSQQDFKVINFQNNHTVQATILKLLIKSFNLNQESFALHFTCHLKSRVLHVYANFVQVMDLRKENSY